MSKLKGLCHPDRPWNCQHLNKKKTKLYITANPYNVLNDYVGDNNAADNCVNDNNEPTI